MTCGSLYTCKTSDNIPAPKRSFSDRSSLSQVKKYSRKLQNNILQTTTERVVWPCGPRSELEVPLEKVVEQLVFHCSGPSKQFHLVGEKKIVQENNL